MVGDVESNEQMGRKKCMRLILKKAQSSTVNGSMVHDLLQRF